MKIYSLCVIIESWQSSINCAREQHNIVVQFFCGRRARVDRVSSSHKQKELNLRREKDDAMLNNSLQYLYVFIGIVVSII